MLKRFFLSIALLGLATTSLAAAEPSTDDAVRSAVKKALPLIEKSAAEYTKHRQCFSCHHQALPILALVTARARGFNVDTDILQKQVAHTEKFLTGNREAYQKGQGQGGQVDTAGYALWALDTGGWKPDATTAAVAEYLLLRNKNLDHWQTTSKRPPSEMSNLTTTYLAIRGLKTFGTSEQKERIKKRVNEARQWLQDTPAKDNEDRVFRLRGLHIAGANIEDVLAARTELAKTQHADGGWSQTDDLASDAYATGSALAALHQAGALPVSDAVYQRGLKFLVTSQRDDGTWRVRSRSKPFQIYFESGFPHGKDQFISMSASSWATTALALAVPPTEKPTATPSHP
jgi:hypothetical protein